MKQFPQSRTPYWWLKAVTTIMGVAYSLMFFGKLVRSYTTLQASGLDVDLAVSNNPQSMIALCSLMAVLAVWILHGKGMLTAAIGLNLILLSFFVYWAYATSEIKANTGLDRMPGSGLVSNVWYGGTWLDPVVFAGALAMAVLGGRLLWVTFKSKDASRRVSGIGGGGGGFASSQSRT